MPIGTYQQTTGGICKLCNESWMEGLESRVRPTVAAILAGDAPVLTEGTCVTLAAWCWKTAAMIQRMSAESAQAIASEQYRSFYEHRVPPSPAFVWVAQFDPGDSPELAESYLVWTGLALDKPPVDREARPSRNACMRSALP